MANDEDISIVFAIPEELGEPNQTLPVTFGEDHVLDVEFRPDLTIRSITVVDSTARLSAAAALGSTGAYGLVPDLDKDVLCIEFRPGAATRAGDLATDALEVNGEKVLWLLWGTANELEGIVIWKASERVPGLSSDE